MRWPAEYPPMLLCLDALRLVADSDPASATPPAWTTNAARVLAQARTEGWEVAHVMPPRPRPGQATWRAIAELAPLPTEAVYHRDQPSVFGSPELSAAVRRRTQPQVVMCGLSTGGAGLATAMDAERLGVSLSLVEDAIWIAPHERSGIESLIRLQQLGHLSGRTRLVAAERLLQRSPKLRVLQGGVA